MRLGQLAPVTDAIVPTRMYVVLLTSFFLICYLAAKSLEEKPLTAICLYMAPHLLLVVASIRRLIDIQRGVEV